MTAREIRNLAIVAHVDHGKTTLVDSMFRFAGTFRAHQLVEERAARDGVARTWIRVRPVLPARER